MLTFRIDPNFYGNARRLIKGAEGYKSYIYPDTAKIPTIGYGYALLVRVKEPGGTISYVRNSYLGADFAVIGITLTEPDKSLLDQIASDLKAGDTSAAATKIATLDAQIRDISATEAQTLFNLAFDRAMSTVVSTLKSHLGPTNGALLAAEMTGSTEMIALVDMAFNGGASLIGPGLSKALWNDDRAEAWYQIRHDSNAEGWREINGNLPMNFQGGAGLAKRRYIEAQMFGLYEASTAGPDEREAEFLDIYRMFTRHRQVIQTYEARYGEGGQRNMIAEAAADGWSVDTLREALAPAGSLLIYKYVPAGSAPIDLFNIQVGQDANFTGRENGHDKTWYQNDILTGTTANDLLIGGLGADRLEGGNGDDVLIGGTGNDVLVGGAGTNYLDGGDGQDYYVLTPGSHNTIVDADNKGIVMVGGTVLAGTWIKQADGKYRWSVNATDYATRNSPLTIHLEDGTQIVFASYDHSGDFGLHLLDVPATPQTTLTLAGDLAPLDTDPATPGIQLGFDALDNVRVTATAAPGLADTLYDSAGNDLLRGLGGDDILYAWRGGRDRLEGGDGHDSLDAGDGDDFLMGNAGQDLLWGMAGDDTLFAGDARELDAALLAGETQIGGGQKGDLLGGGDGDDRLVGDAGDDALGGGAGGDLLIGGGGDDTLAGDEELTGASLAWSLTRNAITDGNGNTEYQRIFNNAIATEAANGGADVLYGGAGNDWLFGQRGDDVLDGGANDDVLMGDEGADMLLGQGGNDVLLGDLAAMPAADQGDDFLDGGAGTDRLHGFGGNDTLDGGDDGDSLWGGAGDDRLDGGGGGDWLMGDDAALAGELHGSDGLEGGEGDDFLFGQGGMDSLAGGSGNDYLQGDDGALAGAFHGNDLLDGGEGNDTLAGDGGADVIYGGEGNDMLLGDNFAEQHAADAYQGDDWLDGGAGDDSLYGGGGSDTLIGGVGTDYLDGGAGDDIYVFSQGDGALSNGLADSINDMQGVNTLEFGQGIALANVTAQWAGGADVILQYGTSDYVYVSGGLTGAIANVAYQDGEVESMRTLLSRSLMASPIRIGSAGSDLLYSGESGTAMVWTGYLRGYIYGLEGDDTMLGGAGNDNFRGGVGNDIFIGAAGNDVLWGDEGNDTYLFGRGDGQDFINESPHPDGSASQDTLILGAGIHPEDVSLFRINDMNGLAVVIDQSATQIWNFSQFLIGDFGIERIVFDNGAGENWGVAEIASHLILDGARSYMVGTSSDDTFQVDNEKDVIFEAAGGGVDTAEANRSYTLPANVENITLTGLLNIGATGNDLNNVLKGNTANNVLDGGAGTDTAYGGAGNDTYRNTETIVENPGEGIDIWINRRGGTLPDNVENMSMDDGPYNTSYWYGSKAIGNDLDNILISSGEGIFVETLDGKAGADTMIAIGSDSIEFYVDNPGDTVIASSAGGALDKVISSITYTMGDFVENLTLSGTTPINGFGNALHNRITGNNGDNLLDGGTGNDTLDGGLGNDFLMGGAGSDTYVFDTQAYQSTGRDIIENHDTSQGRIDTIQFNTTADKLQVTRKDSDLLISWSPGWYNTSSVMVRDFFHAEDAPSHRIDRILFSDGSSWDAARIAQVAIDNQLPSYIYGTDGPDSNLQGTWRDDVIAAGNGNDMVFGLDGSDTIDAGEGDDFIYGGPGSDTLRGGTGNDTYVGVDVGDVVIENLNEGLDTVITDVDHTLGDHVENLVLRGVSGSDAINGTGNAANNNITGNSGANILDGLDGSDTMLGGLGNDVYVVDNIGDTVTEYAGEGTDTVQSSITYTLGANLENLILTGATSISGKGNGVDNTLNGNSASNTLSGGAGNDILAGGAASLSTPSAVTSLVVYARGTPVDGGYPIMQVYVGGVMVQQFTVDAASHTAYTVNPASLGMSSDKIDIVFTNDAYRPEIGQDRNLYVQKIVVNGQDWNATDNGVFYDLGSGAAAFDGVNTRLQGETVYSNGALRFTLADNDTLDGGAGADAMSGGSGNDTYVVDDPGDVVSEAENAGTDLIRSSIGQTLGANVEHLVLTGSAAINGTGNALDNLLMGNAGNNVLTGGAGNDTLLGGAGDDTLDGGSGNDVMQGDQGNDLYIVDASGKSLWERANEGVDTVRSSVNFTLPTDFENLILTGSAAISGSGNGGNNAITGNDANNTLNGGAGNDTLLGAGGNDWLEGGAGADVIDGGAGTDDYASYSGSDLAVNVNLALGQASGGHAQGDTLIGIESLRGSNYDDILVGTSANNSLSGGTGNDTLEGSAGNDWIEGGAGADVINGGDGTSDSASYSGSDLAVNVNLALGQASGGHAQGDVLIGIENLRGSNYNDVLMGDAGNNSINGGSGNDLIEAGAGNDWLEGGAGADSINGGDGAGDWVTYGGSDQAVTINLALNQISGGHAQGDTLSGVEGLWGSNYGDILVGDAGNNRFQGYGGNDFIDGGAGIDAVDFYSAPSGATLDLAAGTASGGYAGTDTLINIENISGSNVGNDFLYGDAGVNSISGNGGDDSLFGRAGNDWMDGGAGNDILLGGAGSDSLLGQAGNDTYLFFRGDGADTWIESDPTPGNLDIARFGADIAHDQIWFRRVGYDLETSVIGTTDKAVVKNWYSGSTNHIERFESGNGKVLLDSQVDALVSAMAAFAPPPPGPTNLPPSIQQTLAPVLAVNWQ